MRCTLRFACVTVLCIAACGKTREQAPGAAAAGKAAGTAGAGGTPAPSSDKSGQASAGAPAAASGAAGQPAAAGTADGTAGSSGMSGSGDSAAGSAAAGSGAAGHAGAAGTAGAAAGSGSATSATCENAGECGAKQFCNFSDRSCGSQGARGTCENKPEICRDPDAPVCGCDDRTYSNACAARAAGISTKRTGLCNPDECNAAGGRIVTSDGASIPKCETGELGWNISGGREQTKCCWKPARGRTCGGIAALACDAGEFCNYAKAAGGQGCDGTVSDAAGVCQPQPPEASCGQELAEVCSCERRSYENVCQASAAGATVLHDGACTVSECKALGYRVVIGNGPMAECEPDETEYTWLSADDGGRFIEGALCCSKK